MKITPHKVDFIQTSRHKSQFKVYKFVIRCRTFTDYGDGVQSTLLKKPMRSFNLIMTNNLTRDCLGVNDHFSVRS